LFSLAKQAVEKGWGLDDLYLQAMDEMRAKYGHWVIFDHCMPFNVSRAFDEASGTVKPRIWTAERDLEMWRALEGSAPLKSAESY
ncbi:MAG: MBL fold metallo-hydrolase, partial [Roseococcus sp.]